MGAIHVHEFMSLDGVIDTPAWTFDYGFDPQMGEAIGALTARAGGILLGRTTYEMFEPSWSTRTAEDDPGAPFFNDTTKYVVSSTLTDATWRNSEIVGAYDPERIRRLKDEVDGLHLFVYPLALAEGTRLFEGTPAKLALATSQTYANGVVHLAYGPA